MTKFPQIDSGLAVLMLNQGDDPIAWLNKAMAFLIAIASFRFPSTNNQLRTSSNLRNQATIQDDMEGRQGWLYVIIIKTKDLDAYDSDYDDVSNAKAVLMANLSNYGLDLISEQINSHKQNVSIQIKEKESLLQKFTDFINKSKEKENKYMDKEIDLEQNIKELDNIVYKVDQSAQTVHMLTKPHVFYDDTHKQALGYQNPFYLKKAQRIKSTLYDGNVISSQQAVSHVIDDEETLILEEASQSRMLAKQNDPMMILESVEQDPLLWPSVEVEGVTRLKKYFELLAAEAIQADCDVKATNIILQGLPPEVYALVSTHKVAKKLWERIQMLMQGTSLTKQERECKLYDAFDKSAYQKGETLLNDTSSTVNHSAYMTSAPQIEYALITYNPSEFSSPKTGLVVLVFQKGDDHIDAINHMMSFLTFVVSS
nr:hypothetical protein [Tanacetum cinerariifolium]